MRVIDETIRGRTKFQIVESGLLKQKFHARIVDENGNVLLWSEKYADERDARVVLLRAADGSW